MYEWIDRRMNRLLGVWMDW